MILSTAVLEKEPTYINLSKHPEMTGRIYVVIPNTDCHSLPYTPSPIRNHQLHVRAKETTGEDNISRNSFSVYSRWLKTFKHRRLQGKRLLSIASLVIPKRNRRWKGDEDEDGAKRYFRFYRRISFP